MTTFRFRTVSPDEIKSRGVGACYVNVMKVNDIDHEGVNGGMFPAILEYQEPGETVWLEVLLSEELPLHAVNDDRVRP